MKYDATVTDLGFMQCISAASCFLIFFFWLFVFLALWKRNKLMQSHYITLTITMNIIVIHAVYIPHILVFGDRRGGDSEACGCWCVYIGVWG